MEDLAISDHAPITISLRDLHPGGSEFVWRFPTHLAKSEAFTTLLRGWWLEFLHTNQAHMEDPSLLWATAKAVLQGSIIALTTFYKKKMVTTVHDL